MAGRLLSTMPDGSPIPRWGKVDQDSAGIALGVCVPLAIFFSAAMLILGWLYAPGERKEVMLRGQAAPLFKTRASIVSEGAPAPDPLGPEMNRGLSVYFDARQLPAASPPAAT